MKPTDLDQIVTKGSILVLTHGEYSDFRNDDPVRVLKTFKKSEVIEAFKMYWAMQGRRYRYGDGGLHNAGHADLAAWLLLAHYVEDLEPNRKHEWHIDRDDLRDELQC